jgi:hypothetical protein
MFGPARLARKKKPRRPRPCRTRLYLEPLEDRTLLAVSITGTILNNLLPSQPGVPGLTVYLDLNHTQVLENVVTSSAPGPTSLLTGSSDPVPNSLASTAPWP